MFPGGTPPPAYNYLPTPSFESTALHNESDEVEVLLEPRSPTAGFETGSLTDTDEEILGLGAALLFSGTLNSSHGIRANTHHLSRSSHHSLHTLHSVNPSCTCLGDTSITILNTDSTVSHYETKKAPAPSAVEMPPLTAFKMLLHILQPDRKVRTLQRKTKVEKVEPRKVGPVNLTVDMNWDAFLAVIAQELGTLSPCLITTSFEWHFIKPANLPKLPLSSPQGLQSMVNQVNAKLQKDKSALVYFNVLILLQAQGPHAPVPVDEDDSDDDRRPLLKKVPCSLPSKMYY